MLLLSVEGLSPAQIHGQADNTVAWQHSPPMGYPFLEKEVKVKRLEMVSIAKDTIQINKAEGEKGQPWRSSFKGPPSRSLLLLGAAMSMSEHARSTATSAVILCGLLGLLSRSALMLHADILVFSRVSPVNVPSELCNCAVAR